MKSVILGIGNTIVSDDGVGIYIVRRLKYSLKIKDAEFRESYCSDVTIIELLEGFHRAFIIDSIKLDGEKVGEVIKIDMTSGNDNLPGSLHAFSPMNAFTLAQRLHLRFPEVIILYGIIVSDNSTFHYGFTPGINAELSSIHDTIQDDILNLLN